MTARFYENKQVEVEGGLELAGWNYSNICMFTASWPPVF